MAVPRGSSQAGARVWAEGGVVQPVMERPTEPLSEGTASSTAQTAIRLLWRHHKKKNSVRRRR